MKHFVWFKHSNILISMVKFVQLVGSQAKIQSSQMQKINWNIFKNKKKSSENCYFSDLGKIWTVRKNEILSVMVRKVWLRNSRTWGATISVTSSVLNFMCNKQNTKTKTSDGFYFRWFWNLGLLSIWENFQFWENQDSQADSHQAKLKGDHIIKYR